MATTDSNGIVKLQENDTITPIQTTLNSISTSVSTAISNLKKDIVRSSRTQTTATTLKNQLEAQGITGTPNDPLLFFITSTSVVLGWDGTAWSQVLPKRNVIVINGTTYQATGRFSASVTLSGKGTIKSGSITKTMPYTPPSGWHWQFTAAGSASSTWIGRMNNMTTNKPKIMFCGVSTGKRTVFCGWQLCKTNA